MSSSACVHFPQYEIASPPATSLDLFADICWPEDMLDDLGDECYVAPDSDTNFDCNGSALESSRPKDGLDGANASSGNSPTVNKDAPLQAESLSQNGQPHGTSRFSKQARSILRTWFHEHRNNPYPTKEEKDELAAKTHLKRNQISLWLINMRRRYRTRKHPPDGRPPMAALHEPLMLDSFNSGQGSKSLQSQHVEDMNPMDRWKALPLEFEAVAAPVILATVAASSPPPSEPQPVESSNSTWDQQTVYSSHCDTLWSQSFASYETGFTSTTISDSTTLSHQLSDARGSPRDRRRRRQHNNKATKPPSKDRPFQCTFCKESFFSTKHDWQRHEISQHLSLESWTCCLSGGILPTATGPLCAFCGSKDTSTAHLETHSFSACPLKSFSERTFYRKDHFQQHLRLMHECAFHPRMNAWKSEITNLRSRCGFCSATFLTWSARADHLAAHFKSSANMCDWKGDLGFESHIAALVERADVGTLTSGQGSTSAGAVVLNTHPELQRPSMPPPLSGLEIPKHPVLGIGLEPLETVYVQQELDFDLSQRTDMHLGMDINSGLPPNAGGGCLGFGFDVDLYQRPYAEIDDMLLGNSSANLNPFVDMGIWASTEV